MRLRRSAGSPCRPTRRRRGRRVRPGPPRARTRSCPGQRAVERSPAHGLQRTCQGGVAMAGATVLLVDDRDTTLEAALQFHGFDVQTVGTGRGALAAAADPSVDAVVLEVDLDDIDGF